MAALCLSHCSPDCSFPACRHGAGPPCYVSSRLLGNRRSVRMVARSSRAAVFAAASTVAVAEARRAGSGARCTRAASEKVGVWADRTASRGTRACCAGEFAFVSGSQNLVFKQITLHLVLKSNVAPVRDGLRAPETQYDLASLVTLRWLSQIRQLPPLCAIDKQRRYQNFHSGSVLTRGLPITCMPCDLRHPRQAHTLRGCSENVMCCPRGLKQGLSKL
mmetsp:Transcript_139446/g.253653  ORF Transcript_139446/g.253653 Transcript_139446/m.253653 type:complete len:219 (-) Transcript_139446:9-665(-)